MYCNEIMYLIFKVLVTESSLVVFFNLFETLTVIQLKVGSWYDYFSRKDYFYLNRRRFDTRLQ